MTKGIYYLYGCIQKLHTYDFDIKKVDGQKNMNFIGSL